MVDLIWFALFLPLVSFLILMLSSNFISRRLTGLIACAAVFLPFLCFSYVLYSYNVDSMEPIRATLFSWIPLKSIQADFTIYLDPLSILMTMIITGVGFLIHVYSIGYMEHEEDYVRYFACMNLFIFAMLLLVLAANLPLLFVGWEGVGLASYLLIGYYYHRPAAAQAATKAFVVNRIGDFGLLVGILLTLFLFQTGDIMTVIEKARAEYTVGAPIMILLTFLFFVGASGKSAQLPLHVWLPDAMEGPTPVSALIHAATMVTAGVYLVIRTHALYLLAPPTMHLVGVIGGATALFAALCAMSQMDLKRVLAYSTVSQLGLMFLACGVAAFYAAAFHLMTHAFMKGLLFLAAGNVVHMMHGTTNMEKMGGLKDKFKITHVLFFVGVLAMSGVPPLAAFFSKDLILEEEYLSGGRILFYVGLFASILTAFYLMRAYCLTFWGETHIDNKILKIIKEAPKVMVIPVAILAALAIFGGFLGFSFGHPPPLERFLAHADVTFANSIFREGFHMSMETWLSIIGAFVGIFSGGYIYLNNLFKNKEPVAIFQHSFYVDEIYDKVLVKPLEAVARWIVGFWEPAVFEGSIRAVAKGARSGSLFLQKMQSGQIRSYIAWMTIGMAISIFYILY